MNADSKIPIGTPRVLPVLAGLLAVTFWGASFVATKIALRQLNPAIIIFTRTGIGVVVLVIVAWASGSFKVRLKTTWGRLLVLGFIGVAFHLWLQAQGLQSTSATSTGWIIATIPIFIALLGWRFLGERMPFLRVLGIGFGALGVLAIISDGQFSGYFQGLAGEAGDVYIMLSAINWAVFTVVSKRWLFVQTGSSQTLSGRQHSPFARMIKQMAVLMTMGWLIMLPWVVAEGGLSEIARFSKATIVALLFLGVACSGLAYIFWYGALTRIDATETGALLYFEPLVTQAVAWPLLGEPLTLAILIGGTAIFIGVWMVGKK